MLISTLHFVERTVIDLEIGTVLSVDDIRSLYTKISHDLGLKALKYWIEKLQQKIEHLQRFSKNFIFEGLSLTLKYNYFYTKGSFIHQTRELLLVHTQWFYMQIYIWVFRIQTFNKLLERFSYDIVTFFLKNNFMFLGDVKYSWKESINFWPLWGLMNSLDPDIKFSFVNVSTVVSFLDDKNTKR